MVWNKTPESKVKEIITLLEDVSTIYIDIAKQFNVSDWLVGEIARNNLSKEVLKKRYTEACRRGKTGSKNPMFGKTGEKHHGAVKISRCMGYKTVFKPDWWTSNVKDSRIYEHSYVYCLHNKMTEVPKGYVIHHKDEDIDNNDISNLQMMTISEHIKHHWKQRKVQRLESNLVGNSVPEAQGVSEETVI